MKRSNLYFGLITLISTSAFSQFDLNATLKPSDSLNSQRRNTVIISEAVVVSSSLIALNSIWYSDFERSKFHLIDDADEWLQMDKVGHVFSSYQLGRLGADALKWSGVSKRDQLIYGATLGFTFLTAVEIFDGFSKEWGFSWSDMLANTAGTGLYIGQELLWNEQRFVLKYSFNPTYLASQRPDKLGDGFVQEMFKDYNGQTYWLSFNLYSFLKESRLPKWLNVAFGYGAYGMLTGKNESETALFQEQDRFRQYYLSLDLDLTKIKTESNLLKTVFSLINVVKIPMPTLEINSNKKVVFHLLFY